MATFTISSDYKYVLLAATCSTFIPLYHSAVTNGFRKKAGVSYPNAYATAAEAATSNDKYRFNCAQKAHANFTENHTSFLCALLIAGLKYPMSSAVLGGLWSVARVLYVLGYTRKENAQNGKGRLWGVWWAACHVSLIGMAVVSSVNLL